MAIFHKHAKSFCLLYYSPMFKNIDKRKLVSFLSFVLKHFYAFESLFYNCKNINYPKQKPVIFALWHAHQCALYANEDRGNLNVMISKSNDGDIIAAATEHVGIKVVRGSSKRSGASASLALLEKLEQGECAAITIDGPRGPFGVVKEGIINIAKLSQVPIVPMIWYSPSKWLLEFDTWDKFRFPFLGVKTIAVYGEPIYVKSDCTPEEAEEYRLDVENKLKDLYKYAQENFEDLLKS